MEFKIKTRKEFEEATGVKEKYINRDYREYLLDIAIKASKMVNEEFRVWSWAGMFKTYQGHEHTFPFKVINNKLNELKKREKNENIKYD